VLKKVLTAITALAVVASLLAGTAGQAAAVSGYDSAYFGESAFLTLGPGQSGQFAVGFNNTGSTGWLTGSASQVDLSICLPDKTTCNTTSPNAAFASSWLSSTAYATTSTTFVGPGQTGFFVYDVTVPSAASPGVYSFNGDLALHGTASMIHPQGYYQDVEVPAVGAPAKLACSATPTSIPAGANAAGTFSTLTVTAVVQDTLGNTVTTNSGDTIVFSQAPSTASGATSSAGTFATPSTATHGTFGSATTSSGSASDVLSADANTIAGTDQISVVDSTFPTLTGCPVVVTFAAAGAPTAIVGTRSPSGQPAGVATTSTATATLVDANGAATTATSTTVITFTVNDITICTFAGAASTTGTIAAGAGAVTVNVNNTGVPGTCTITMTGTGLTSGSASYPIAAAGAPALIAFTSNNSPQNVPGPIVLTATVQDAAGNRVFGNTDSLTFTTTTTACAASLGFNASTNTTNAGAVNPYTQAASNGARTVNAWDNLAQTCTVKVTDNVSTATATASITFTGFLSTGANKLTESNSPPASASNPLPADGVATTTATICVADVAGNTITTGTGSTDVIALAHTGGTGTTQVTSSPQTAVNGCVQYTIRSTARAAGGGIATDTYLATDASRTLAGSPAGLSFTKTTNAP